MTPEEVLKRCDENTIGVVPTLGVTFTCQFEPVKAVADALDQLEKDKGWTSGCTSTVPAADFWRRSAPRIWSGTSAFPASSQLTRRPQVRLGAAGRRLGDLARSARSSGGTGVLGELSGGNMRDIALNFSRPGGRLSASTTTFFVWARKVTARFTPPVTIRQSTSPVKSRSWALRDYLRWRDGRGHSGTVLENERRR